MAEGVGQRIKRLRLAAGLSQRDLSGPGVSYAYISRIEAGARSPSVKALRRLAVGLGVTAEYLETGETDTLTDRLVRAAAGWTDEIEAAIMPRFLPVGRGAHPPLLPVAVVLRYTREGMGERTVRAPTLTEALLELRAREEEVDRLLEERTRIDRSLEESR